MLKLTAATALATLAFASPAAAQSVVLTPAADPVEDVPFLVTASGVGAKNLNAYGTIKPVGPVGCGPTYETDAGEGFLWAADAEGAFNLTDTASAKHPGTYLVCAWLQESSSSGTAIAVTSAQVAVRSARATLAIGGPSRIPFGQTANFTFSGATELGRSVYATVKRDGPRGCGTSSSVDDGNSFLWESIQGTYAVQDAPWRYEIDARGTYRICAWVQEDSSDTAPEAAATYTFTVGTSSACLTARDRVTRARRAVRRAHTRAKLRTAKRKLSTAKRAARRAC